MNQKENYLLKRVYGDSNLPLPFFQPIKLPVPPEQIPFLPTIVPEACGSKIILGAVTGYIMGLGLGGFMGVMGDVSGLQIINGKEVPQTPLREQMRVGIKQLSSKSLGMGKTFGVLTALFGGSFKYCFSLIMILSVSCSQVLSVLSKNTELSTTLGMLWFLVVLLEQLFLQKQDHQLPVWDVLDLQGSLLLWTE